MWTEFSCFRYGLIVGFCEKNVMNFSDLITGNLLISSATVSSPMKILVRGFTERYSGKEPVFESNRLFGTLDSRFSYYVCFFRANWL
jgi:hypothetical protein